jgi:hypothetical protein
MDIILSTRAYETWMRGQIPVVKGDLDFKHRRMAESAFVFLRGTFYRWMQLWPATGPSLAAAPRVPSVGDLHVENFGTWRDSEGRLVWGVNDVDEACLLPYTQDLVRLATSAVLATLHGRFRMPARESSDAILEGYVTSLSRGGSPLVLAERRRWLRAIALNDLREPRRYWLNLDGLRTATGDVPHDVLTRALPERRLDYRVVRRTAGVGSLGRPRFVALAEWRGARVAREAKAWLPSAAVWATGRPAIAIDGMTLLARAVRAPDPCIAVSRGWIVRRLAPDCSRVELDDLPKVHDEQRLLAAMGWETANIHLGRSAAKIAADLKARPRRWLERAAMTMSEVVSAECRRWSR